MNQRANKQNKTSGTTAFLSISYKAAENNPLALLNAQTGNNLFLLFMENSQVGCWIYDADNVIVFANAAYSESLYSKGSPVGLHISEVMPEKLAKKIIARNKKVLQSGKPIISEYTFTREADGAAIHFISNAFTFEAGGKYYVGGQSVDVTAKKNVENEIEKMHDRYKYVINATSEAIWDFDLTTNEIYRSDAFYKISGYKKEAVGNTLNWWLEKLHPEDKEQVNLNIENALQAGKTNWQSEYRFKYADGTYRYILDRGFAVYENKKPVRLIGAIQDITDRKLLELQLLNEQVQKQKLINQTTIEAQEKERSMISAELHDNVNQLLMSAKLHISAAKNNENAETLINKASDYLLHAVEEIRSLTKKLNSSIVKTVGLELSIMDICHNMKQFSDIEVSTDLDAAVIDKLTQDRQLVIFRIIQEQSNNIIKYSRASAANISLTEKNKQCQLIISDNGIGFDKTKQKANGIGFINIFNRVDAYNGKTEITTFPDNGCTICVTIPYL